MGSWFRIVAAAVAMSAAGGGAAAQSPFPSKPVHIFVPYAAGGGVDILARTLGDVVSRQWGQTVVVENRPGAGGVVASQALVAAPPDGYTLIVVASGHATNPFLDPKIPYDTFKDFTPISLLASSPNILLVRTDSPFKTLGDMIAQAPRPNRVWKPFKPPVMERKYELVATPAGPDLYEMYANTDGVHIVHWVK
jgi:tripartite-type tricarboxylate transporter receptor subunit TctC